MRSTYRVVAASVLVMVLAGCGTQVVAGVPAVAGTAARAGAATLAPGPVTVVAVGDSLTAGVGDSEGTGFVGRLTATIASRPGRADSTLVNLGRSGWTSTGLVDGQDGLPGELGQAVDEVRTAGGAVLATVLIGSTDLWYVYQYATVDPAPAADEDAAVETYRANLDRTVRELRDAGAVVVVGLPDDQTRRPGYADLDRLHEQLPDISAAELANMSRLAARLVGAAQEVAAAYSVRTVETDAPFWADAARMDPDGIHPNGAGYAELAARWAEVVDPMLS